MAPVISSPQMGRACKENVVINSKTRKRLRLKLDLEPGILVVFVVEQQRWLKN